MDWLNLHSSVLDSPECLRCDPVRRATWVWLLRYCIGQENSGTIIGCKSWGDTTWQQLCRVRLREVNMESPLWSWDGDNMVVSFYPSEKQAEVQAKRESGKKGGRPKAKPSGNHVVIHQPPHQVERPETEGKGREGEGKGSAPPPASPGIHRPKDHWPHIQLTPWYLRGIAAGCRISATNWPAWAGAISRTGDNYEEFFSMAESMPPDKRWFDKIEAAMATPKANGKFGPKYMRWIDTGEGDEPQAHE